MEVSPQFEKKQTSGTEGSLHRRFFEEFSDMLFTATGDWRLIEVNEAGVGMFRYACKGDMCKIDSIASLFRDKEEWRLFRERIEAQGFAQGELAEMQRRDGSRFPGRIPRSLRQNLMGRFSAMASYGI